MVDREFLSNWEDYRLGIGASQEQIDKKNRRMQGGALSMIAGMMTKVDETAMEREKFYYNAVIEIIKELFFRENL